LGGWNWLFDWLDYCRHKDFGLGVVLIWFVCIVLLWCDNWFIVMGFVFKVKFIKVKIVLLCIAYLLWWFWSLVSNCMFLEETLLFS
jgi:hypothetical protein